jgi:Ser/Thr protein kinase RdoA (MazF antagonist)
VAALEGPVRLELAALTAGVPMPRPCLAEATGAGVAEVAAPGQQPVLVRVHEWVDGSTPTAPASMRLAGELGDVLATIHRLGVSCSEGAQVPRWYRAALVRSTGGGWPLVRSGLGVGGLGACAPRCRC